jgi:probable HAF family extracellular repeat protein
MTRIAPLGSVIVLILAATRAYALGPPSFTQLGALPGSQNGSTAMAISSDGRAVAGISDDGVVSSVGFRWRDGVMVPLTDLAAGSVLSEPWGLSTNGDVCTGIGSSPNGTEGYQWEAGVIVGVGDLPTGAFYSHAFDVSGDGSIIVGLSRTSVSDFPFRWEAGVMTNLSDDLAGGPAPGHARRISDDGSTIVGFVSAPGGTQPFRWQGGTMELLGLSTGAVSGAAQAVSADGSVIVGYMYFSNTHREAFRWQAGVFTLLGDMSGGDVWSTANDVSGDGSVIIGCATTGLNHCREQFIWTAADGMRRVQDVLADYNLSMAGWFEVRIAGVSADGLSFAGSGEYPAPADAMAWLAHIGCALTGDTNNDGACSGADIPGFVRCLLAAQGCGCADVDGSGVVDEEDIDPFVQCLTE